MLSTIEPVPAADALTSNVVPLFGATSVIVVIMIPVAVEPVAEIESLVNVETLIGFENTTLNCTDQFEVGSACPTF